jgi:hypothetical protein
VQPSPQRFAAFRRSSTQRQHLPFILKFGFLINGSDDFWDWEMVDWLDVR